MVASNHFFWTSIAWPALEIFTPMRSSFDREFILRHMAIAYPMPPVTDYFRQQGRSYRRALPRAGHPSGTFGLPMAPKGIIRKPIRSTRKRGNPAPGAVNPASNASQEIAARFFAPPAKRNADSPMFLEPLPDLCYNVETRGSIFHITKDRKTLTCEN